MHGDAKETDVCVRTTGIEGAADRCDDTRRGRRHLRNESDAAVS